jgi:uncharacterized membrane-anchored protein YjiN (DUF445 family)
MSLLRRPDLSRLNPAQGGVRGMRILATAMLAGMAAIFVSVSGLAHTSSFWAYVRAFAEAGLVGGIADWFAVTALFRHPLGLPIPHTAIVPRNKDRIGDTLANFLKDNFLTPSVVARRMRQVDVAGAVGRFLSQPRGGEGRLRQGGSRLLADILEALDPERLGGMVKSAIAARLHGVEVAPLLGETLAAAVADDRHVPLLDALLIWAGKALDAHEGEIRRMTHRGTPWAVRVLGIDKPVADRIIGQIGTLINELIMDVDHPLRREAEEGLARLAGNLRQDPELMARVEAWKDEMIDNQAVGAWLDGIWEKSREGLLRGARDPDAALAGRFGEALRQLGETLQEEPRLKRTINQFARRATVGAVASYGDGIVKLVSETVRGWDARTISDRLEGAVGRDLQYIRINGTLVGGLVGVAIHAIESLT